MIYNTRFVSSSVFHSDKRKRTSEVWMSFLVDSGSESQLEVVYFEFLRFRDFVFLKTPVKTRYPDRLPEFRI